MRYAHISAHQLIAPWFIFNSSIADNGIESSPTFVKQWFDFRLLFIFCRNVVYYRSSMVHRSNIFAWQPQTYRHRALLKPALAFQKSKPVMRKIIQRCRKSLTAYTQYPNLLLKNIRSCMNLNMIKKFRVEFEESTEFSFSNNVLFCFRSFVRQLRISWLVKLNFYHTHARTPVPHLQRSWKLIEFISFKGGGKKQLKMLNWIWKQ